MKSLLFDVDEDGLISTMHTEGVPLAALAANFGCSEHAIRNSLKRTGTTVVTQTRGRKPRFGDPKIPGHKHCTKCGIIKPLADFWPHPHTKMKVASYCKACTNSLASDWAKHNRDKAASYVTRFRLMTDGNDTLTAADILAMRQANPSCNICGKPIYGRDQCVDHCHRTGIVRGVLCRRCNSMLGMASDLVTTLEKAIEYLRKYENTSETRKLWRPRVPATLLRSRGRKPVIVVEVDGQSMTAAEAARILGVSLNQIYIRHRRGRDVSVPVKRGRPPKAST